MKNKRPYVGVYFKCCRIYSHVFLNKSGKAYVGWCPKCAAKIEMRISPSGSRNRIFMAD